MSSRHLEASQLLDEKVFQRYVFEKLNESAETRKALLPTSLHGKATALRVVIPEYDLLDPPHRADFRMIFRDKTATNIEVEWTTSAFRHGALTATAHYSMGKGFLIVLSDDRPKGPAYTAGLDVVEVDPEDFSWWFSNQSKRLLDTSIAIHVEDYAVRSRKCWIVYVGSSESAQDDYLRRGRKKGTWAFRYTKGGNMRNIMSILKEDIVVFATRWRTPGGRQIYPGGKWRCDQVDVFEVTRGYWCDFKDKTFEDPAWDGTPETKRYMHYLRFSTNAGGHPELLRSSAGTDGLSGSQFRNDNPFDVEICRAMRKSNTQSGAPVEMSIDALANLRRRFQ